MVFHTKKGVFHALREIDLKVAKGEFHADRPLGLRQVDAAEPDRRPAQPSDGVLLCANREIAGPSPERSVVFQNHRCCPG
jgi:nitrate/nitrite transport system ATP-binding protein